MKQEPTEEDSPLDVPLDPRVISALRRELVAWYRAHRRELPWRATTPTHPNPYHVLVSETMLQQTQVVTVVPYFQRFIERFPDLASLAAADEQDVLHLWQGLGYYRRAQNLHAAAKKVVKEFGGQLPRSAEGLLELPGVGRYTAGAVASIAFGEEAPILDGNVARVLSRLWAIEREIDEKIVIAELWRIAGALAKGEDPGDLNQSLMELGALNCTPTSPRCDLCPVADWCEAKRRRLVADLPRRTPRRKPLDVQHHVVAIRRFATFDVTRLLWEQRETGGLWAGMWQMPTLELTPEDKPHRESDIRKWLIGQVSVRTKRMRKIGQFKHQTTHRTIEFTLWLTDVDATDAGVGDVAQTVNRVGATRLAKTWRPVGQVDDLPLANPQKTAIKMLLAELAKENR